MNVEEILVYVIVSLSIVVLLGFCFLCYLLTKLWKLKIKYNQIEEIYKPASIKEKKLSELSNEYGSLQENYNEKLAFLRNTEKRLSYYLLGVGTTDSVIYSQLLDGKNIEEIEARLNRVRSSIKDLLREKKACICNIINDFTVNGKKSEAKKLFNREIKLRIRCLDNEFKSANALVDWNNINRLIERSKESFNGINASGNLVQTFLQNKYLDLKIEEFRLNYELNKTKQKIREDQLEEARIQREAEREEQRIKADAQKAIRERKIMEALIANELRKLDVATEEQKALFELHKQQLQKLREKERRAISLAQTTRAGYVYIISNRSFYNKNIIKIGMTRRSDPSERVKELSRASVPFHYDVHAFAFTNDAPNLEKFLHNKLSEHRVNQINGRKEFFYTSAPKVLNELKNFDGRYELTSF